MASTSEIEKLERRWADNSQGTAFTPLAEAYRKSGDIVRALECLRPGLVLHPNHVPARIVLGRCHLDLGEFEPAAEAFRVVLQADSENVIALKALADISERQEHYREAEQWLAQLLSVDRSNDDARQQLARMRARMAAAPPPPAATTAPPVSGTAIIDVAPAPAAPPPAPLLKAEVPVVPVASPAPEPPPIELELTADFSDTGVAPAAGFEPTSSDDVSPPDDPRARASLGLVLESLPEGVATLSDLVPTGLPPGSVQAEELDFGLEKAEDVVLSAGSATEFQVSSDAEALGPNPAGGAGFQLDDNPQSLSGRGERASGSQDLVFIEDTVPPAAPEPPSEVAQPAEETGTSSFFADALGMGTVADVPAARGETVDVGEVPPAPLVIPIDEPLPRLRAAGPPPPQPMEPEAAETGVGEPEPVVTETMAEIYAAQGHRQEAIEVYRTLLARTPGDIRLQDKLARLEGRQMSAPSPAATAPFATHVPAPALAAAARTFVAAPESGASVTSLLQRVLGARLGGGNGNPTAASDYAIPEPPAAPPPPVPTAAPQAVPEAASTLDRVFDAEAGSERDFRPAGAPTRPAEDRLSLSSVFGDESAASPLDEPEPAPRTSGPVRKPMSASSFDAFFSAPASEPSTPTGGGRTSGPTAGTPQGDDLDQFQGWLKGLKR